MAKYLGDLSLGTPSTDKKEAIQWALSTNFLRILYLDSLPRVVTNGVPKVIIKPCRELPENPLKVILRKPDILELSKQFNLDTYWTADKEQRKRMALEFLQEGLLEIARTKGWDEAPFQEAYQTILRKNFVNYRPWSAPVTAPDRRHKAQIWCNYDSDKAEIFVVIFCRKEIVKRELVTTVKPGDVWIRNAAGKLKWESKSIVKLTSKDESQVWEVDALK